MRHKQQSRTLMSDIPTASFFILPLMVSHTFPTNWCGITNTKMSASLDASTRSGTASWGGKDDVKQPLKWWYNSGHNKKKKNPIIYYGDCDGGSSLRQREQMQIQSVMCLYRTHYAKNTTKYSTFWDYITSMHRQKHFVTVKWWETNSFLPHLLVVCAQGGTSHFHGQCWLFQSACARSPSPQTPTF